MDIQSIDVGIPEPTIAEVETIISTLLVSDWTVRGWTLLEGIRGSRNIYLLCKHDRVVNLRVALLTLHERGAVDIAVLLGSAQHLVPHADPAVRKSVEEGGYLLSRRHTSWPEDVIICWSLLTNSPPQRKAANLWQHQCQVRTGFLLSSAPRVHEVHGFGWAPASPYLRSVQRVVMLDDDRRQEYTICFPCYDGEGSLLAKITPSGLLARWRVIEVNATVLESTQELCCVLTKYQDEHTDYEESTPIYAHPDEASAWYTMDLLLRQGSRVRLVRALAEDGVSPYFGSSERAETFGLIAAICASGDRGKSWEWKGVFSWQESENHPGWHVEEMLMV
jgi:hypothetical protein